jgi:subtilase family serine protease
MYQPKFALAACLLTALAGTSAVARSAASQGWSVSTSQEAPRVLQSVNAANLTTLPRTHGAFIDGAKAGGVVDAPTAMNHLQLVLKRSATRQAALDALSADQHDPRSPRFHRWLTPEQFGDQFGVADGDIAAASSWLTSKGFKVNAVYPNKMQIDFSGTAGLISAAFHTRETHYVFNDGSAHVSNDRDIQVPAALGAILVGVSGLDDVRPQPLNAPLATSKRAAAGKNSAATSSGQPGGKGQSIPQGNSPLYRLLVPNDLVTMYGIRTIRNNGVVGAGIKIALIESGSLLQSSWDNFVSTFDLARYGGTLAQVHPQGPADCPTTVPLGTYDDDATVMDAEWATAIAPGARIVVANCYDLNGNAHIDATIANLVNDSDRPNVISVNYSLPEYLIDLPYKSLLDNLWAQADLEGISVFVPTGNIGSGYGSSITVNAMATSPNVTAVGGTDLADVLDGTTDQYFAKTPSVVGGSALSYVPEIPWNETCGNGVAAKQLGYSRVVGYCNDILRNRASISPADSEFASSGGPSTIDRKPAWQNTVYNAPTGFYRAVPDVAVFGGSFGNHTGVVICTTQYPCKLPTDGWGTGLRGKGTEMSSAVFAGVQALMDQGLAARGTTTYQGNAAPVLYALAAEEFGTSAKPSSTLSVCNADNGATGTADCIFHNVTRGSTSSDCSRVNFEAPLPYCYFYYSLDLGLGDTYYKGLTTADTNPTSYGVDNKAYSARPGWSFASGLGSVNATNLLIAWRAFENVSGPAHASSPSQPAPAIELY